MWQAYYYSIQYRTSAGNHCAYAPATMLTLSLSDRMEGVIILNLGTSDCSFSYVPCIIMLSYQQQLKVRFNVCETRREEVQAWGAAVNKLCDINTLSAASPYAGT